MRQVVVVASVTQDDDRGPLVDGADMIGDEVAERAAKVRVRVHIDDITLECDVESFLHIVGAKTLRDLADIGYEDETAHARVEVLERIDELQHEARGIA